MQIKYLSHYGGDRRAALVRGSAHAAAYDLAVYTRYHDGDQHDMPAGTTLPLNLGEQILFGTGVCLDMTEEARSGEMSVCAVVVPRSGIGAKGLMLANTIGVIDADYQGEVKLALKNVGRETLFLNSGMRVAQILFVPVFFPDFEVVDEFATVTERGVGGFGSTGVA